MLSIVTARIDNSGERDEPGPGSCLHTGPQQWKLVVDSVGYLCVESKTLALGPPSSVLI